MPTVAIVAPDPSFFDVGLTIVGSDKVLTGSSKIMLRRISDDIQGIGEATAICMHDDFVFENVHTFTIQHNSCAAMELCAASMWDLYLILRNLSASCSPSDRLRRAFEDDKYFCKRHMSLAVASQKVPRLDLISLLVARSSLLQDNRPS